MPMRLQMRGSNERKLRELLKMSKIGGDYISKIKQDIQFFLHFVLHLFTTNQMVSAKT
jgi:hypothetical protein